MRFTIILGLATLFLGGWAWANSTENGDRCALMDDRAERTGTTLVKVVRAKLLRAGTAEASPVMMPRMPLKRGGRVRGVLPGRIAGSLACALCNADDLRAVGRVFGVEAAAALRQADSSGSVRLQI